MTSMTMPPIEAGGPEGAFFGILRHGYGYRSMLYLLLSPLIAYFYVTALVLSLEVWRGTLIVLGLALILACAWPATIIERGLAHGLLGVSLTPMAPPMSYDATIWDRFKAHLLNPVTWKSLVYLGTRIVFGVFAFVLMAGLLAISLGCLLAPALYFVTLSVDLHPLGYFLWMHGYPFGGWMVGYADHIAPQIGYSPQATVISVLLVPFGIVASAVSLHIMHGVGAGWGWYARNMLGINPQAIELAQARAAAETARQRADRAEEGRRQLILDASHELRTPVATIRAHIDALLLLQGNHLPEQVRNYLAITQHEIERLSMLVDDLLMLARADTDGLRLTIRPVTVGEVVEEVFQAMEPLAIHERQVTLVHHVAEDLPQALADRERLAQVILNLVRNAITYTPAGGIVSLDAEPGEAPDVLTISVTDTGIGIDEDDLPHIFERFYRTDASRARHSGGFGLGLSITRDLIEAMGGSVLAEQVPAGGSRFIITLPIAAQATPRYPG